MGSDASQQEDSGQHTAALPTPPMLSGDTPIAPTPEQVRKPGVRTVRSRQVGHTRQGGPPVRIYRPRSLHFFLTATHGVCVILPV